MALPDQSRKASCFRLRSWNMRGNWRKKAGYLYGLLEDEQQMLLLQETHITTEPSFGAEYQVRADGFNNRSSGTITCWPTSWGGSHRPDLSLSLDNVRCITVDTGRQLATGEKVYVTNVYIPPGSNANHGCDQRKTGIIKSHMAKVAAATSQHMLLVMGDFNNPGELASARCPDEDKDDVESNSKKDKEAEKSKSAEERWNEVPADAGARSFNQRTICNALEEAGLSLVSTPNDTGTHRAGNTLDLVYTNRPNAVSDFAVDGEDSTLANSDHRSISCTINGANKTMPAPNTNQPRWALDKADWETFRRSMDSKSHIIQRWVRETQSSHQPMSEERLAEAWNHRITTAINATAMETVGQVKRAGGSKPWLTNRCRELYKKYRRLCKRLGNSHVQATVARQQLYMECEAAKTASWARLCNDINKGGKIDWKAFEKTSGAIKRQCGATVADEKGIQPNNGHQGLNNLAQYFTTNTFNEIAIEERSQEAVRAQCKAADTVRSLRAGGSTIDGISEGHDYNRTFTEEELRKAVFALAPNKATGRDRVHTRMIRHMGKASFGMLQDFYNHLWANNITPKAWKSAVAIPLFKKGNQADPDNYRLITLNSVLQKVMEQLVLNRLRSGIPEVRWHCDQYGFRKQRSTTHAILHALKRITAAFDNGGYVKGVFLDLSKAFDTVSHDQIMAKLCKEFNVRGHAWRWIDGYLRNRTFFLKSGCSTSNPFPVQRGTPQGGILSPLLFLVLINEVGDIAANFNCDVILYADDMLVIPRSDCHDGSIALQKCLDAIGVWAERQGLKFNLRKGKSAAVCFHRHGSVIHGDDHVPLTMNGTTIPAENRYRYLGVVLDRHLAWRWHRHQELANTNRMSGLVRRVVLANSTLTPGHVSTLVKALVVTQYAYACAVIPRTRQHDKRLISATVRPLKAALSLPFNTHSNSVLLECGILSPLLMAEKAAVRLHNRAHEWKKSPSSTNEALEHVLDIADRERKGNGPAPTSWYNRAIATHTRVKKGWKNTREGGNEDEETLKQIYKRKALKEFWKERYGSSLRCVYHSLYHNKDAPIRTPKYFHAATIELAKCHTAIRFDTCSPWRAAMRARNGGPAPPTPCSRCGHEVSRVEHFFGECTAQPFASWWLNLRAKLKANGLRRKLTFAQIVNHHYAGIEPHQIATLAAICAEIMYNIWVYLRSHAR